jgi:hypothetical protein
MARAHPLGARRLGHDTQALDSANHRALQLVQQSVLDDFRRRTLSSSNARGQHLLEPDRYSPAAQSWCSQLDAPPCAPSHQHDQPAHSSNTNTIETIETLMWYPPPWIAGSRNNDIKSHALLSASSPSRAAGYPQHTQ